MPLFLGYLCSKGPNASLALIQLGFTARGLVELISLLWCCIICNSVSVCVRFSGGTENSDTGKTHAVCYLQTDHKSALVDARSVIYLWGTCLESDVIQHHGYAANPVFVLGQPICGEPGSEVSLQTNDLQQQVGFGHFIGRFYLHFLLIVAQTGDKKGTNQTKFDSFYSIFFLIFYWLHGTILEIAWIWYWKEILCTQTDWNSLNAKV